MGSLGWGRHPLAGLALGATAGLLLTLSGCSVLQRVASARTGATASAASAIRAASTSGRDAATARFGAGPGRWYCLEDGRVAAVGGPAAVRRAFEPWTVQTRVAGFLAIRETLYLALNGWGVVAITDPDALALTTEQAAPAARRQAVARSGTGRQSLTLADPRARGALWPSSGREFRLFEARTLFAGRAINGFSTASGKILVHLYRNTVFSTAPPQSPPIAYVRIDPTTGRMSPVALPPTRKGWEAIQVIDSRDGSWVIAWKRTTPHRVRFRYTRYDPASGTDRPIDRRAFFEAYDFKDISHAPVQLRAIAKAVLGGSRGKTVLHLLVRRRPYERVVRFREGSEALLESGEASLVTAPVVRSAGRYYALLPNGRLLWATAPPGSSAPGRVVWVNLPTLPPHFVYTGFWTDGRVVVASWEHQRFAEVAAAGIYIAALSELS